MDIKKLFQSQYNDSESSPVPLWDKNQKFVPKDVQQQLKPQSPWGIDKDAMQTNTNKNVDAFKMLQQLHEELQKQHNINKQEKQQYNIIIQLNCMTASVFQKGSSVTFLQMQSKKSIQLHDGNLVFLASNILCRSEINSSMIIFYKYKDMKWIYKLPLQMSNQTEMISLNEHIYNLLTKQSYLIIQK
ncbi:Hypothetical_protein [Hexamita inflata]|uniref:Hypothetical_protein n=1 Tax=Hexamita inflata TaxID=28002 RepID=A0AA86U012_9EUKA|nr:Hypothetical protein HINF_LOCUS21002 [Hexamita inflata]